MLLSSGLTIRKGSTENIVVQRQRKTVYRLIIFILLVGEHNKQELRLLTLAAQSMGIITQTVRAAAEPLTQIRTHDDAPFFGMAAVSEKTNR